MTSPVVRQTYARAHELAERGGDERQLFQALYGRWQNIGASGMAVAARPLSDKLLQVTARGANDGLRLQAHHSAWTTRWVSGELAEAYTHTREGCRLYDPERHASHRHTYGGHDPGVCAHMTGGQAEWVLGYPDRAAASTGEGLALADRIAHPFSREVALEYAILLRVNRRQRPHQSAAATGTS